jgi:hypothetical protein
MDQAPTAIIPSTGWKCATEIRRSLIDVEGAIGVQGYLSRRAVQPVLKKSAGSPGCHGLRKILSGRSDEAHAGDEAMEVARIGKVMALR